MHKISEVSPPTFRYGGPGSYMVDDSFPVGGQLSNFLRYLSSTHRIMVASVDGRGSSRRGEKFKFEMYRKLGTVEVEDQMEAGRCYLSHLSYL